MVEEQDDDKRSDDSYDGSDCVAESVESPPEPSQDIRHENGGSQGHHDPAENLVDVSCLHSYEYTCDNDEDAADPTCADEFSVGGFGSQDVVVEVSHKI